MSHNQNVKLSRVQTKFEENSLPARRYIMIGCFILGSGTSFNFGIGDFEDFTQLSKALWEKNKDYFINTGIMNELNLKLWKVEIPTRNNKKYSELKKNPRVDIDIEQEFGGVEIDQTWLIDSTFTISPPKEHIHIIVQPPPVTTGKRRLDYDCSEDRDRKKSKLTVPETILTRVQKIMEDIKNLPEDRNVYSNPETLISLPFPFIGKNKPVERFSIKDGKFWSIGRKAFDVVLNVINDLVIGDGFMKCFVYGTMGYGKSHIFATIVCFLIRTGKRVVYLPDCRELAMDTKDYIKSALYLAYENDSDKISKIHACETLDEIVKFCKEEPNPLYIVVDQMNALDGHNNTEINETIKQRTIEFLNRITTEHYYIKSSSANNTSALHLQLKQTNEKKIELYGGFDEDEMSQWWIKNVSNLPLINDKQKEKIEYITGRNPLFLSFFLGSEKDFENALDCLKRILIKKIKKPMTNFSDIILKSERWDLHVQLMSSCLTNGYPPSGYGDEDYDHRFFYVDNDERCYYTSGLVRDCMANYLFEKGRLDVFTNSSWIQCIREFKNNPSVMGFMVEKACLSSIFKNGFMAEAINFKPDNYKFFTSIKEINFSINEGSCTFYLPRCWNQKSIDGLVTLYKLQNKKEKVDKDTLYIVPIQITFDKETHSDSEASFFSRIWPELKSKILGDLRVEVIFIWFTRENNVTYFNEVDKKILKERTIEINPLYKSTVIAFKNINIELGNILLY